MRIVQICVAILLVGAAPYVFARTSAPVAPQTVFQFVSAPGDYIGQGQTLVLERTQATFNPQNTGNLGLVIIDIDNFPAGIFWTLNFSTATGSPLTVGSYANATGGPFQNGVSPGLSLYGDGRGCNRDFGHFDVLDIAYDPVSGALSRFAANFAQSCETPTAPVLAGAIRFNSSVPVPELIVPIITVTTPLNRQSCVEATSPAGGVAAVSASAAGGANLKYTWATANGSKGSGPTFSLSVPLKEGITLGLTATDSVTGIVATTTTKLCASDTTPPTITIVEPAAGAMIRGDNVVLDVRISDVVDKHITSYDVDFGMHVVSPLDPLTGRSRQRLEDAPKTTGPVVTTITVHARDASGNVGTQSVTFSEVFERRHDDH